MARTHIGLHREVELAEASLIAPLAQNIGKLLHVLNTRSFKPPCQLPER